MPIRIKRGIQTAVEGGGFRARSNADIDQRVGAAQSRALNLAADAARQIGATAAQWHQIEKNAKAERDRIDLASGREKVTNIMNDAAFEAGKATSPDEVDRIMDSAFLQAKDLVSPTLRGKESQDKFALLMDSEGEVRELQAKKMKWNLSLRETVAKDKAIKKSLTTSARTVKDVANNKFKLHEHIKASPGLTEQEKANDIAALTNEVDFNFANHLLNNVNLDDDPALVNEMDIESLESFVKDSYDLNDKQRNHFKDVVSKVKNIVHTKKLNEDVSNQIADSMPQNAIDVKEFSDKLGYQNAVKKARADIDSSEVYKNYDKKDRDYIKGGVERQMQAQWEEIQRDKDANFETFLTNPNAYQSLLTKYKFTSPREAKIIKDIYAYHERKGFSEDAAKDLQENFRDYQYDPNDFTSNEKWLKAIASQPPEAMKAWNMMLADKREMHKKGGPYKRMYDKISNSMALNLKITGEDTDYGDVTINGRELSYNARLVMWNEEMNDLVELGRKYQDDPESFNAAAIKRDDETMRVRGLMKILHITHPEKTKEAATDDTIRRSGRRASRDRELENR